MIIFDTLNRFAPGLDENSVKDTTFITDSLMSLRNKGATIIALHQVGKEPTLLLTVLKLGGCLFLIYILYLTQDNFIFYQVQ